MDESRAGEAARSGQARRESAFHANLDAFGGRAAQLCSLLRRGRLTADACFLALTQLWIQLARSHGALRDPPEGEDDRGPPRS